MEYPNWFDGYAKHNFIRFLDEFKDKEVTFLQLGAYTGDASVWLVQNILTNDKASLWDVDTWTGSDEAIHHTFDWSDVLETYLEKTDEFNNQLEAFRMTTDEFFRFNTQTFDFIYVDADHTAQAAYTDGVNSWKVLKPGGILAFDDYTWGDGMPDQSLAPKPGINKFLDEYKGEYEVLLIDSQVWIRKPE